MKFAIFAKSNDTAKEVKEKILKTYKEKDFVFDEDNPEVVFVAGGDGTFLRAVHHYLDSLDKIKFAGIRCGSLGFFYDFAPDQVDDLINLIANNEYCLERHHLVEADVNENKLYAVNEICFEIPFHTLVCDVKVDGISLEKFHGNGLLICNELGSTAYNKSIGGAVISRDLELLELTEIGTIQNNVYRSVGSSFVFKRDTEFVFEGNFENVVIGYDHLSINADEAKNISVKSSDKVVNIIYRNKNSDLEAIKRSFVK